MNKDKYKKSLKEAGPKEIFLALVGAIGVVLALVLFDNLILENIHPAISLLIPIIVVIWLFVMPKKDRKAIENTTNKFKQTTIGKIILPAIFGFLVLTAFVVVIVYKH
ncbi:MAG: hypothetical protein GY705_29810 [Bacteroidetes bacterium]|nr:hypothetical protein [Bacteroidota bacterium]